MRSWEQVVACIEAELCKVLTCWEFPFLACMLLRHVGVIGHQSPLSTAACNKQEGRVQTFVVARVVASLLLFSVLACCYFRFLQLTSEELHNEFRAVIAAGDWPIPAPAVMHKTSACVQVRHLTVHQRRLDHELALERLIKWVVFCFALLGAADCRSMCCLPAVPRTYHLLDHLVYQI